MALTRHLEALIAKRELECSGQSGNRSWRVRYHDQAQILKHIEAPAVIARHRLLGELEASGRPPPGYITPVVRIQSRQRDTAGLWVMTPYREGRAFSFSQPDIQGFFRLWSQLRFWSSAHRCWLNENARIHTLSWVAASKDVAQSVENALGLLEQRKFHDVAQSVRHGMRLALEPALAALSSLPKYGLIHGDLHGGNLIYSGPDVAAAVDWDEVAYGPPEYDLAKAVWLLCRKERGQFELCHSSLRYFLDQAWEFGVSLDARHLVDIGALAFCPTTAHVNHLLLHDRVYSKSLVPWYVEWLYSFWCEFPRRRELVAAR